MSIKDIITSNAARQLLLARKNSPQILFAAGTVGVVTATVLACRATLKLDEVLTEHEVDEKVLNRRIGEGFVPEEEAPKKSLQLKVRTGAEIVKLYAPAVIVGGISIAALTGSHVTLTKRNGAAMAAYAGLDRAYKEYRNRVVTKFGEDVDREFASAPTDRVVVEQTAEGTVKKTIEKADDGQSGSPYTFMFDEFAKKFSREPGRNAMTIQMVQNYANDKLRAQGHLFLNEVLDMLGIERTKAGAVVGWVYRKDNEAPNGDNYVDFGVFDGDAEEIEKFIDGVQSRITMNFNVDGMILDLI